MKRWLKTLLMLGGAGLAGTLAARFLVFRPRQLSRAFTYRRLAQRGLRDLAVAQTAPTHGRLVIVAHGFMDSMSRRPMVTFVEALSRRFDVLTFDFSGHGMSRGSCDLDFEHVKGDLEEVIAYAHRQGHQHIGVVGYSMGAAAAILAAADDTPIEAVAAVCCPAGPRHGTPSQAVLPTALIGPWIRLMGTRVAPRLHLANWPIEHVAEVSPIPLLIVHHEYDYLVSRDDSEALFAVARPPKEYVSIPGAFHAHAPASQEQVIEWLDRTLPCGGRQKESDHG